MKSGDTKGDGNAGLSLHHKNRIILTNYRNENLMGRVNTFAYQRLIGIVHLDDFPVDFNKSSFSWNGGLEAKFIESLSNNYVFSDMKKKANDLRKRAGKNTPKKEEVTKINAKQTTQFKSLETVKKVQIPLVVKNDNEPVVFIEENTVPLYISYEGIDYTFFIEYVSEVYDSDDWVKIVTANIEKNEYLIRINNNFKFFDKLKKSDFALIQQIVLLITLAQLSSVRSGFKDSHKFIQKMNEIIKILEK